MYISDSSFEARQMACFTLDLNGEKRLGLQLYFFNNTPLSLRHKTFQQTSKQKVSSMLSIWWKLAFTTTRGIQKAEIKNK